MGLGSTFWYPSFTLKPPGFPLLTEIIQTVGDVGTAIAPGFCRYESNDSKTKSQGYLVFPFSLEYQVFRNKCPDTLFTKMDRGKHERDCKDISKFRLYTN